MVAGCLVALGGHRHQEAAARRREDFVLECLDSVRDCWPQLYGFGGSHVGLLSSAFVRVRGLASVPSARTSQMSPG